MQAAIERGGGVVKAAEIVELAASTNQPVVRVPNRLSDSEQSSAV
ncbi:hypothetical protein [Rubripirellula lacrimiformis]|nr:hypothetical protein [Rubripirellula lacrimiformis]